jgi:hypothetical protein
MSLQSDILYWLRVNLPLISLLKDACLVNKWQTHLYYPWFDKYGDRIHDIPHSRGEPYKPRRIWYNEILRAIEYNIFIDQIRLPVGYSIKHIWLYIELIIKNIRQKNKTLNAKKKRKEKRKKETIKFVIEWKTKYTRPPKQFQNIPDHRNSSKIYQTAETVPKSNRNIVETEARWIYTQHTYTHNTNIHDRLLYCLSICTSKASGWLKGPKYFLFVNIIAWSIAHNGYKGIMILEPKMNLPFLPVSCADRNQGHFIYQLTQYLVAHVYKLRIKSIRN